MISWHYIVLVMSKHLFSVVRVVAQSLVLCGGAKGFRAELCPNPNLRHLLPPLPAACAFCSRTPTATSFLSTPSLLPPSSSLHPPSPFTHSFARSFLIGKSDNDATSALLPSIISFQYSTRLQLSHRGTS